MPHWNKLSGLKSTLATHTHLSFLNLITRFLRHLLLKFCESVAYLSQLLS